MEGLNQLKLATWQPTTTYFDRLREEAKPDPWAMTDADIAVYDKAFIKQDKDKDGFITLRGERRFFIRKSPRSFRV